MAQNDFNPRTDLAVEEREQFTEGEDISGVAVDEWEGEGRLRLTRVEIKNEQGARAMGKPAGVYVTIESEALAENDPSYHEEAAAELGVTCIFPRPATNTAGRSFPGQHL